MKKIRKELLLLLLKTALLAAGFLVLFTCVIRVKRAAGNEMSPFVRDGDLCIFLKLQEPRLQDVVLFRNAEGRLEIGRVIAAEEQEIDFPDTGGYTLDGYLPSEEIPYETWKEEKAEVEYPLKLKEDQLFLMHDFRSLTGDSRSFGPVEKSQIQGTLLFLLRRRGF